MFPDNPSLIPLSIIAFFFGLILKYKRLCGRWSTVVYTVIGAIALSLLIFIKFRHEGVYNVDNHIRAWPYAFLGWFSLIGVVANQEKLIPRLTEGITLIQSLAIIYWVVDVGVFNMEYTIIKIAIAVGCIFCLYSFFHAFTYSRLSRSSRLMLSIWSSIIMMCFAADFLFTVYHNKPLEFINDRYEAFYASIQYFLLGISFMYIIQNCFMIIGFLPGKGTFFNAEYFRDLDSLKSEHMARYEKEQVHIGHSFVCVVFCALIFGLNYYFQFFPRTFVIWISLITFPMVLYFVFGVRRV